MNLNRPVNAHVVTLVCAALLAFCGAVAVDAGNPPTGAAVVEGGHTVFTIEPTEPTPSDPEPERQLGDSASHDPVADPGEGDEEVGERAALAATLDAVVGSTGTDRGSHAATALRIEPSFTG